MMPAARAHAPILDVPDADLLVYRSRPDWLIGRQAGFGSSDAAGIWGVSSWASPTSVFVSKVTPIEEQFDATDEWLEIGSLLEEPIAQLYAKRTGREVLYPGPTAIYRSKQFPFMLASVDRLVLCEERGEGGLECKNRNAFTGHDWDEGVPIDVQTQVQHQMAVTGRRWWDVGVLIGGSRFMPITIERDDAFIEAHVEKCTKLWRAVQRQQLPEPDGSEATAAALKRLFRNTHMGEAVELPKRALTLALRRKRLKEQIKKREEQVRQTENWLRQRIGDAEIGKLPDGSVLTLRTVEKKAFEVKATSYRQLTYKPAKENR